MTYDPDTTDQRARRLFRWILAAYPRRFRDAEADEMWSTFSAQLRDARRKGVSAILGLWIRELGAAVRNGIKCRVRLQGYSALVAGPQRGTAMITLIQDCQYAIRALRRAPTFSLLIISTLALGLGACASMFSVVHGVLLKPLPYDGADDVFMIWTRFLPESGFDLPEFWLAEPEFLDYRDQTRELERVAAFTFGTATLITDGADPERVRGIRGTADFLPILRVQPVIGRTIREEETLPGAPGVVLLSHHLWQRRFGADSGIVGRTINISGRPQQVIGVTPPTFSFLDGPIDFLGPLVIDPAQDRTNRGNHYLQAIARISLDGSRQTAERELSMLMEQWRDAYPTVHTGHALFLRPLLDEIVGNARPILFALLSSVGVVLLIVCANVANVFLARGETRRSEMALRTALGARFRRILQQIAIESFVLCVLGGTLGLMLAHLAVPALMSVDTTAVPRSQTIGLDATVVVYTIGLSVTVAIVLAIMSATHLRVTDVQRAIQRSARGSSPRKGTAFRHGLVVGQMGLSILLAITAGLVTKSFRRILQADIGFETTGIMTATLALPSSQYESTERALQFWDALNDRIASAPGIRQTGGMSVLPMLQPPPSNDFQIVGRLEPSPGEPRPSGGMVVAQVGHFAQMGIPILRGRTFEPTDRRGTLPVVIVNQQLADQHWPNDNPIGSRIIIGFGNDRERTVVGVVGNVRYNGVDTEASPTWYLPVNQTVDENPWMARFMNLLITTDSEIGPVSTAVRSAVRSLDPNIVVGTLRPMDDVVSQSLAGRRFTMGVMTSFAGVAMFLAAVGIYGLMSYSVVQRFREIAIRSALGATERGITALLLKQAAGLTSFGLIAGIAFAFVGTRFLDSLLFGVTPTDPSTFGLVFVGTCLITLSATWLPARRAASIDPVEALRG